MRGKHAGPVAYPRAIQPDVGSIPLDWLDELDDNPEIRDLAARLSADNELLLTLQLESFAGPAWEIFVADVLVPYGLAVLTSWIRTGTIFSRLRERRLRGVKVPEGLRGRLVDAARELASDAVSEGVIGFRDHVLKPAKWTAAGGATLRTYFIGQCLIRFVDVARAWVRDEVRIQLPLSILDKRADPSADPERRAVSRDQLARAMATVDDPVAWRVAQLTADGTPQDEIASILGLSSQRAVEGRLYRLRARLGGERGA